MNLAGIVPIDRQPFVNDSEREVLRAWRKSPEGALVLRVLTVALRPMTTVSAESLTGESAAYRLGARDMADNLFLQLHLIGTPIRNPERPEMNFGAPKTTKGEQP